MVGGGVWDSASVAGRVFFGGVGFVVLGLVFTTLVRKLPKPRKDPKTQPGSLNGRGKP